MGSPEKPIDLEMGDMEETEKLNPEVKTSDGKEESSGQEEERFTGLKKDELLEVSNQRQWVIARWILFVLFWVGWVGMLVGAIIIVVQAPRCKKEPTPPWYQNTVVYQADVRKFDKDLTGMTSHLGYIKSLNAKTLTVCHASDPDDPTKVVEGQEAEFRGLVKGAHGKNEDEHDLKVVVDFRIDVLSVLSPQFQNSAIKNCSGGNTAKNCRLFVWKANDSLTGIGAGKEWRYHPARDENYAVSTEDPTMAFLDYSNPDTKEYLKMLVEKWVGYGADGFQLRGLHNVQNAPDVVLVVRKAVNNTGMSDSVDSRKIGLFLISSTSTIEDQAALFGGDVNDTMAPVVINTQLSSTLPDTGTGEKLKEIIQNWRDASEPYTGAYAVNTMDLSPLAGRLGANASAGLSLLAFSLPGVPVVKSGDEALLADDTFTWPVSKDGKVVSPTNSSTENIDILREVAAMRVNPYRSLQSLRWDNEDAKFEFRDTNSTDILAFTRVWDTKPKLLVVSNLSKNDQVVKIASKEEEKSELTVVAASCPEIKEKEKRSLGGIKMYSGLTLILKF